MFPEKYMHISVDDVIYWLRELNCSSYSSVFEHPVFELFQKLHRKYGVVFTMNVFFQTKDGSFTLTQMTERFKSEFEKNSHWLRFSFHGYAYEVNYHHVSPKEALWHYETVRDEIIRFASLKCLDTVVRIHFFSGSTEVCRALRDCRDGITGILTSDDSRPAVYYLNEEQRNTVYNHGFFYDKAENLCCIKSFQRLDNLENPTEMLEAMYAEGLQDTPGGICAAHQLRYLEIFWHESTQGIRRLESICRWASVHGYSFLFSMDDTA